MYEQIKKRTPNFDLHPVFEIPETQSYRGEKQIFERLHQEIEKHPQKCIVVIDNYYEINQEKFKAAFIDEFQPSLFIDTQDVKYPEVDIQDKLGQFITDDRINGVFSVGDLSQCFDQSEIERVQAEIEKTNGLIVVLGVGAALVVKGDICIYNNITIQRIKDGYLTDLSNWGANNPDEDPLTKEKRFNFVETRLLDNHKRHLFEVMDFVIDGDDVDDLVMTSGDDFRTALKYFASHPFKLQPFFNRGVWGGHWCKDVLNGGLDKENTAWGMNGWMNAQNAMAKLGENEFRIKGKE